MKPVSRVAEALPRSGIREVMELAATIEGVIHLEVGEPSFNTPPHIVDAALSDARAGYTKYTANAGFASLRAAIAQQASSAWQRPVAAEQVIVTTGAVGALATALMALLEEGDEILIPDPGWPNYVSIAQLCRARPVFYGLRPEDGYIPDPRQLAAQITPRTKLLLLNTPSNPTGAVFPAETMQALFEIAVHHDLYVVSDEVYEELVFDGAHVSAGLNNDGRVIVISGCSKTYAMTGWRLGYAIADPGLISLMAKLQEPLVSCASAVSQRAAEAALRGPQDGVEAMRAAYRRRRDLVVDILGPAGLLPVTPHGAFYAMVDLSRSDIPSPALARQLLREERVATAPGETFGQMAAGMVRISLATDDAELEEGCRRIRAFAARHARASEAAAVDGRSAADARAGQRPR